MTRRDRIAAIVAAVLFFVLVGTSTAAALWSTSASIGTSVKIANLAAACGTTAMINASFEDPALGATLGYANDGDMPGWRAKDAAGNPVRIEIWRNYDNVQAGTGNQHVELNADVPGTLYQTLDTIPGQTLQWSLMHRGRSGTDVIQLLIGAENATGVSQGNFSDDNTAWRRYTGAYVVPAGQTRTTLAFQAVSAAGGPSIGNFLDDVSFGSGPCLANNTTVRNVTNPGGTFRPNDVVEYTSVVTNSGSSLSQNTVYEAVLPSGLNYNAESITIDGAGRSDALTGDQANYVTAQRKVVARLGTGAGSTAGGTVAQNTQTITVKFLATIPSASAGTTIDLTPSVTYFNGLAAGWELSATSNTVSFPVAYGADLATTVAVNLPTIEKPVGTTSTSVVWTTSVTNNGPLASSTNTTVTIQIPTNNGITGTTAPVANPTAGVTCTNPNGAGQSVCTIAAGMASGATRVFTVTRGVPGNTVLNTVYSLTATAASTVTDPNTANNAATTTATFKDTVLPTTPGTPTAVTTPTTANVSWTASTDNSGIAGYSLFRNGVLYQTLGNATSFNDTGLTPWTTYTYQVFSRDNATNVSVGSGIVTVTTTPGTLQVNTAYKISRTTTDYIWWGGSDEYCAAASTASGAGVLGMTTTCGGGFPNQTDWTFVPATDGFVRILTGPTANPRAWSVGAGTSVTTVAVTGSNDIDWRVTTAGTGYMFESRSRPGQCVDQTGAGTMGLANCNVNDASQRFAVAAR